MKNQELRNIIHERINDTGLLDINKLADELLDLYEYDPTNAKKKSLLNLIRNVIASEKDSDNVRNHFSMAGKENNGLFMNTNKNEDDQALDLKAVELDSKAKGYNRSANKLRNIAFFRRNQVKMVFKGKNVEIENKNEKDVGKNG